jgi:hypothetical protein
VAKQNFIARYATLERKTERIQSQLSHIKIKPVASAPRRCRGPWQNKSSAFQKTAYICLLTQIHELKPPVVLFYRTIRQLRASPKTTNAVVQGKNVKNTGGWAPEVKNAPCGL